MESKPGIEKVKVVVRYANGKVVKGFTQDFFPNKECFHLTLANDSSAVMEIPLRELKALFLVRDFTGDPGYGERKKFLAEEKPIGKKLEVTFKDGEVMVGTTLGYDRNRQGFFLFPVDPKSNNVRAFILSAAVKQVKQIA